MCSEKTKKTNTTNETNSPIPRYKKDRTKQTEWDIIIGSSKIKEFRQIG